MRLYLDSANFCLAAIEIRPDAYYTSYMQAAWRELQKNRLCIDTKTGIVYESGVWIERPSGWTLENEITTNEAFKHYLARHVRARAARLHNRADSALANPFTKP